MPATVKSDDLRPFAKRPLEARAPNSRKPFNSGLLGLETLSDGEFQNCHRRFLPSPSKLVGGTLIPKHMIQHSLENETIVAKQQIGDYI